MSSVIKKDLPVPNFTFFSKLKKVVIKPMFEFAGIFISIVLAFALENWDEEQKKIEKELIYLSSLHEDLSKDYHQLDRRIREYDNKTYSAYKIMEIVRTGDRSKTDSVIILLNSDLTYNFAYTPNDNTYKSLESSGDLKLISNSHFKIMLMELDKSYQTTTKYGDLFLEYTNSQQWTGFLLEHMDYANQKVLNPQHIFCPKFFNRVSRLFTLMETYNYNMQGTLIRIEKVREELEEELIKKGLKPDVASESELGPLDEPASTSVQPLPRQDEVKPKVNSRTKEEPASKTNRSETNIKTGPAQPEPALEDFDDDLLNQLE